MYIPNQYNNEDIDAARSFIQTNGFGIIVSQVEGKPWATHIPLVLGKNDAGKDILMGHISKANKQWKDFNPEEEVLVIFTGPHAYISSSWYDHENVPTWNYVAVHVYGKVNILEGEVVKKHLSTLVDKYEATMKNPVQVEHMSKSFLDREMKGIIGFEIIITSIQSAIKLSQNRDDNNYHRIINELEQRGDIDSIEIARLMKYMR